MTENPDTALQRRVRLLSGTYRWKSLGFVRKFRERIQQQTGFPWRLWAALLVVSLGLFLANWFFPPSFEHSFPQLMVHGDTLTVEFDAINHTRKPVTKKLSVSVGTLLNGDSHLGGPHYIPRNFHQIFVSLAPSETKHIRSEFPCDGRVVPNGSEVTILE